MLSNPHLSNLRPSDGTRLSRGRTRADIALFNESQPHVVITFAPRHASEILDFLKSRSVPHTRRGEVVKDPTLTIESTGKTFAWPLENLRTPFEKTIPLLMEPEV